MQQARLVMWVGLALTLSSVGQTTLRLKNRAIDTSGNVGALSERLVGGVPVASGGRVHLLLQFNAAPGDAESAILHDRGGLVTGYVHENGWVVSIDAATPLDGLGLRWVGVLEAVDKIAVALAQPAADGSARAVLVEFHPDVDMPAARALVLSVGGELRENPDLAFNHLLALVTGDQIQKLAGNDAVAYLFPASDDLVNGRAVVACAGALTEAGSAGQYTATMGDGWDGPGLGSAVISYSFVDTTPLLPSSDVLAEILRAQSEWSKAAAVTFQPGADPNSRRNINIRFATRDHGDGYAFDGLGGALAHTFYPSPPNPEPLAGDMHFDAEDHWQIGPDTDLYSVAVHELGHALGLGHSDRPGAVMYPYYQRNTVLTAEDIGAIQTLYAAPTFPTTPVTPVTPVTPTSPSPDPPLVLDVLAVPATTMESSITVLGSVTGGAGGAVVKWVSDRGSAGTAYGDFGWSFALPLLPGVNNVTITATDSNNASAVKRVSVFKGSAVVSPTPSLPSIAITYPGSAIYTSSSSSVNVRGTASSGSGVISRVEWVNSRGGSGAAKGTTAWETGAISMSEGSNAITVTATAGDGSTAKASVQINYARPGSKDSTAPTLAVGSPAGTNVVTTASSMVFKGTAFDNTGVTAVTWSTSAGDTGSATGTTNWQTPAIPLYVGYTTISIRAYDAAGNVSWRTVQVTRR